VLFIVRMFYAMNGTEVVPKINRLIVRVLWVWVGLFFPIYGMCFLGLEGEGDLPRSNGNLSSAFFRTLAVVLQG
jgi:hypothetical protein